METLRRREEFFANEVANKQEIIEEYLKKFLESLQEGVKKITLDDLGELKELGVTTEQFLDCLCSSRNFLLHGSTKEIIESKLRPQGGRVFASNRAAIAIMRSIYSNLNVNLDYPYFISSDSPLELKINTGPSGAYVEVDKGFVYLVDGNGFRNDPEGSWQFVKESEDVPFRAIIETEKSDFKYPVEIVKGN